EIVEVVASHYLEAFRAAPDAEDAPAIKAKTRDMLSRAGERAASLAAGEEALRYFAQAIELTDEPLVRAELCERAGRMARLAGRNGEAASQYQEAIEGFRSIGLTHPAARVSAALGEVIWQEGRIEEAVASMEEAFRV